MEVTGRDYRSVRVLAWCVAEAWAAGQYETAELWARDAWSIIDGRDYVDDGDRYPEEPHPS